MWAFDVAGWLIGEAEDGPRVTPIAPPAHGQAPTPGEPWPRWRRVAWALDAYPTAQAQAIPEEAEMWRVWCALIAAGRLQAVRDAIAAIEDPVQRAIVVTQFEKRPILRRRGQLMRQLMQRAGITEEERDALFLQAAAM